MSIDVLKGKEILAVDDEPDVLEILEEELSDYGAIVDTATRYDKAMQKLSSLTYDLAILDIMGVRGFELLEMAVSKQIPVVMLTAHAISPEAVKKTIQLGARAYLTKDQLGQVAPFVEDVFELSYQVGWKKSLEKMAAYFGQSIGPDWRKSEKEFWEKFEKDLTLDKPTIITP